MIRTAPVVGDIPVHIERGMLECNIATAQELDLEPSTTERTCLTISSRSLNGVTDS